MTILLVNLLAKKTLLVRMYVKVKKVLFWVESCDSNISTNRCNFELF
jgi:hypothetical protein